MQPNVAISRINILSVVIVNWAYANLTMVVYWIYAQQTMAAITWHVLNVEGLDI